MPLPFESNSNNVRSLEYGYVVDLVSNHNESTSAHEDIRLELDNKADKATTYTKTEVDTIADTKADKSTTYTKYEVDTIADGKLNTYNLIKKQIIDIEIEA